MDKEECREMYKQWLKEALESFHALNTGGSPRVVVDQNGERVEYTAANRTSLWAYIMRLQSAIKADDPCNAFMGIGLSPVGVTFR